MSYSIHFSNAEIVLWYPNIVVILYQSHRRIFLSMFISSCMQFVFSEGILFSFD